MRENQCRCYRIPVPETPEPPVAEPSAEPYAEPSDGDYLADLFWGVARQLRHGAKDTSEHWNVTPGQARALAVLTRHGLIRLSVLSEHLRIAPRSTTEVVDALEEAGLVE